MMHCCPWALSMLQFSHAPVDGIENTSFLFYSLFCFCFPLSEPSKFQMNKARIALVRGALFCFVFNCSLNFGTYNTVSFSVLLALKGMDHFSGTITHLLLTVWAILNSYSSDFKIIYRCQKLKWYFMLLLSESAQPSLIDPFHGRH